VYTDGLPQNCFILHYILSDLTHLRKAIYVLIGAILLLAIALINTYPLITQDTGAYLNMAYAWFFPSDRPAFYGVFIKFVSITKSIWWPIIAQSVLLSYLMLELVEKLIPSKRGLIGIVFITLMVLLTPVTWIASQITADIFTAITLLASLLFILESNNLKRIGFLLVALYALLTHNSNTLTMLCFSTLFIGVSWLNNKLYLRQSVTLFIVALFSFGAQCTSNLVTNDEFTFSKQGHVFFMGKMVESGILKSYLDEHCANDNYQLCAFKDSLPPYAADFIWQEGKAFHKTGGWHASKPEYVKIIKSTFTETKYLKLHIRESVLGTFEQVTLTYVGDLLYPFTKGTHPYKLVKKWLPNSIPCMIQAKQQHNQLSFRLVSAIYAWTLFISFLCALILLFSSIDRRYKMLIGLVIIFIVSNAFVTATFANVIGRLNARVVWVLPFITSVLAWQWIQGKRGHKKPI